MEVVVKNMAPEQIKSDAIIVGVEEGARIKPTNELEKTVQDSFSLGFKGEYCQTYMLNNGNLKTRRILVVGLGKRSVMDAERIRRSFAAAVQEIRKTKAKRVSVAVLGTKKIKDYDMVKSIVEGIMLANYSFSKYKTEKPPSINTLEIIYSGDVAKANSIAKRAKTICDNTNFARDLCNEPGDSINPLTMVELVKRVARKSGLRMKVIDDRAMKRLGLNLILSVGQGSKYPPRLIVLEYGKPSKDTTVLVGKGITFDAGGMNLKPSGYIENMKSDKAGAVAVLSAMKTLAELKTKKSVVGLLPLCENMLSSSAQKPGNIVKSYSGTTVEVIDTDAEGRLILADALAYAEKKFNPSEMIDLATLTGSCVVTFGEYVAGMLANNDALAKRMFEAGQRTGERVWQLPLYEDYAEEMKGDITDLKNLGYNKGRYAGAITGAAFLSKFVSKPWIHLDIAGTDWFEKPRWYVPSGATGFGVRLLVEYLTKDMVSS